MLQARTRPGKRTPARLQTLFSQGDPSGRRQPLRFLALIFFEEIEGLDGIAYAIALAREQD